MKTVRRLRLASARQLIRARHSAVKRREPSSPSILLSFSQRVGSPALSCEMSTSHGTRHLVGDSGLRVIPFLFRLDAGWVGDVLQTVTTNPTVRETAEDLSGHRASNLPFLKDTGP